MAWGEVVELVSATLVGLDDPLAAVAVAEDEPIGASGGIRG